jgi:hypothetical protein
MCKLQEAALNGEAFVLAMLPCASFGFRSRSVVKATKAALDSCSSVYVVFFPFSDVTNLSILTNVNPQGWKKSLVL